MNPTTVNVDYEPYEGETATYIMDAVTVTVEEVFNALKENGFDHLRETWFSKDGEGKFSAGCVLGQAALNLDVIVESTAEYDNVLNGIDPATLENGDGPDISPYFLESQLNLFSVPVESKWFISGRSNVGSAIIHWNDKQTPHYSKEGYLESYAWDLPTYEDVVNMAYDILAPYFEETITLATYHYDSMKQNQFVEV